MNNHTKKVKNFRRWTMKGQQAPWKILSSNDKLFWIDLYNEYLQRKG